MQIKLNKVAKANIFCEEYANLTTNNVIEFDRNRFAIIYGPNGTGKTSLAKVFDQEPGAEYSVSIDSVQFTEKDAKFAHVISDQNDRNVIQGNTQDFILGDNVKREYELKRKIDSGFKALFDTKLIPGLKSKFGISTKQSQFDGLFTDKSLLKYISDLANTRSKGRAIDRKELLNHLKTLRAIAINEYEETKFKFFVADYKEKDSAIRVFVAQIFNLDSEEKQLLRLDENDEALRVLEKFHYLNSCVICDHEIDREQLLQSKQKQKIEINSNLNEKAKKIIDGIIKKLPTDDPFGIAESLKKSLRQGDANIINEIKNEIAKYSAAYPGLVSNYFVDSLLETSLLVDTEEYANLTKENPEFGSEDIIFIEKFLNDCLDRKISLSRDADNNLLLLLGSSEFLNCDRKELSLSNGEQNFLSLAFELLKAQKVQNDIIILDDPISSFDSIYKNKITYAILKLLSNKRSIILTHNTDLIKLLEHQQKKCFRLYFLNNTSNEENGLIGIEENEIDILLYIPKFLTLLRGDIKLEIRNELTFLIAVTPFLRGCSQIFSNFQDEKDLLTDVMHGYQTKKVNLTQIYNKIIGPGIIENEHVVSALDITNLPCDNLEAISPDKYPLLHKTLSHTFTYLYLRLNTEKVLASKYSVNTNKYDMLTNIITEAFKGESRESIHNRVFFLSRKTLLNEFNHFEMDMNIFQPAIDITNQALKKEKEVIMQRLSEL